MLLSVKGPVTELGLSLVVFGIQNGNAIHLGTVDAQDFEIANLIAYYDNDMRQFLVCLVNSNIKSDDYLGESDIDLTVKITPKVNIEQPQYTKCKISLDFIVSHHFEYASTEPTDITKAFPYGTPYASGSFTGNTFTGSYNISNYSGTISATLNRTLDTLKTITWHGEGSFPSTNSGDKIELTATIPLKYTGSASLRWFETNGADVCTSIKHFDYTSFGTDYSSTTTGHECNEVSRLYVEFRKE